MPSPPSNYPHAAVPCRTGREEEEEEEELEEFLFGMGAAEVKTKSPAGL